MSDLIYLFEAILNENPNQAIKFLKDKSLDPNINPKGKKIFDDITAITKGDGFTALLTRFYVNDRKPLPELQTLYIFLRSNKDFFTRLRKPVVNYETYRELRRDIDDLENRRALKRLYNQMSFLLRQQADSLEPSDEHNLREYFKRFRMRVNPLGKDFATLKSPKMRIVVNNITHIDDEDDDESRTYDKYKIMVNATVTIIGKQPIKIRIPLYSIGNYINQYRLNLDEIIKSITHKLLLEYSWQ